MDIADLAEPVRDDTGYACLFSDAMLIEQATISM